MRTLLVLLSLGLTGTHCQPKDAVLPGFPMGFYSDSDIMTLRSRKYEQGGPGMWSWLPPDAALSVTCSATGVEHFTYSAWFKSGDDHLGYSWEDTIEGCLGPDGLLHPELCEVTDVELCEHVGMPWAFGGVGCDVRRGYQAAQGTHVYIDVYLPPEHTMNTCATACDPTVMNGFCWVIFVHPSQQ